MEDAIQHVDIQYKANMRCQLREIVIGKASEV